MDPKPNPEAQKHALIDAIIQDRQAYFDQWRQQPIPALNRIPRQVFEHFFIPRELLMQSDHPENIGVAVVPTIHRERIFFVAENMQEQVTDTEVLLSLPSLGVPREETEAHGIDWLAYNFSDYIMGVGGDLVKEVISPHHKILLFGNLRQDGEMLEEVGYQDREELRGKGIGRAYHEKLREFARLLGATMIIGEHANEKTRAFFMHLGRILLNDIPEPQRQEIISLYTENEPDYDDEETIASLFVEFLDEETRKRIMEGSERR